MILPVVPQDKLPLIQWQQGRAIVARYIQTSAFQFTTVPAVNWEALEAAAQLAVEAQVGQPVAGHYPCPLELAAQAAWA